MKFTWSNIIILVFSVIVIYCFTRCFAYHYDGIRPEHKVEVKNSVHVLVKNEHGEFIELDTTKYKVQPVIEEVTEKPLIDGTDYSSYLISFISVLATFVVIANFVNAKELSNAREEAEKAKDAAEQAKVDTKEAKSNFDKAKKNYDDLLKDINETKGKVEGQKNECEKLLKNIETTQGKVEDQNNKIGQQLKEQNDKIAQQLKEQNDKTDQQSKDIKTYKKSTTEYLEKYVGWIKSHTEKNGSMENGTINEAKMGENKTGDVNTFSRQESSSQGDANDFDLKEQKDININSTKNGN